MSELLRIQSPNILFHVINRGNAKQIIFHDEQDFQLYLDLLQHYKKKFDVRIYHFVLMSNHTHLLLEPMQENTISRFMLGIDLTYARYFNQKYHGVGHVWQSRFRSIPIEADEYYLRCARYIELNPVRANIVHHPLDYPWSSYAQLVQPSSTSWTDTHPLLADVQKTNKEDKNAFQTYVEDAVQNLEQGKHETFARLPAYGSAHFIRRFSELRQRRGKSEMSLRY